MARDIKLPYVFIMRKARKMWRKAGYKKQECQKG
jgi:hypothetical protein